ncbi:MAG TPA: ABC transporter substrate-binding protein [Stellaceae bacterium]|jgi:ABC-type nitrate/sulfonate/bicarbonate transport system substrate-binding protein
MGFVMSRRAAIGAIAGSLAALRIPAARAAKDQAGDILRVGKAVVENIGFIPLDVGMEYGTFAKQGLAIEEMNFAGGAKIAQAMTAGAVDISLSAGPDMAFVAKGAPEIAIASIAESPSFMAYVVGAQSQARGIDDLKGKKVGITSPGSLTDWLANDLNRAKGWTSDSDRVTGVAIGGSTPATVAALKTGQVEASIVARQLGYQLEEQRQGRLLFDCAQYVGTIELYTIFANTALTEQKPDFVRRFLKGWLDAIAFMKSHKDETVRVAAKVMGNPPAVASRTYDSLMGKFSTDGKFSAAAVATLAASFKDLGSVPGPIDMTKLYTERFLPSGTAA